MQSSASRKTTKKNYVDPDLLPDVSKIVIDDGKPVDNIYSERQMRLLVDSLYASWAGPGDNRPFLALANVGIFVSAKQPPLVPDVLLSLDVAPGDARKRENLTYFVWIMGKLPELVVEVVSNKEGGELGEKKTKYARMGITYYVVWDPDLFLKEKELNCFLLSGGEYQDCEPWFPLVGLGLKIWNGEYQGMNQPWLRWHDESGQMISTGLERARQESERAKHEAERADQESERANKEKLDAAQARSQARREKQRAAEAKKRADVLAEKLRSLGIDPESV